MYNIHFEPPITEGICDECGARLVHRKDDEPETVRNRLVVYRRQTEPLVEFYERDGGSVLRVDGAGSLDAVTRAVQLALTSHFGVEA